MRISLKWLGKYISVKLSPEEIAHRLTMVGLEVESLQYLGERYRGFVVGEVKETSKHPQADRLTVCKVNVGKDILQIVCGAPNVAPEQKVAVGLVGAEVPRNQHDPNGAPFVLSQVNIRGVDSYGMICSEFELDLGSDKDGILVLDADATPGVQLAEYLGFDDFLFEIGITPNRPDAMSYIGIARELSAITRQDFRIPRIKLRESKRKAIEIASIDVLDTLNCPRYTARVLQDITVAPSPGWMQESLRAVGIRPVNNVVDITNYVLMECGHPLHAFDYDKLAGGKIIVNRARGGELFKTLDHKERKLCSDTLMICDAENPIAIAGVMGGIDSEISDSTKNVILESAYFDPGSIRRTSKHFGISTDASQRFERGADPDITRWAADRAASLMQELCGAQVLAGYLDIYPQKILPRRLSLRVKKANEILGTALSPQTISASLARIEIRPSRPGGNTRGKKKLFFEVPTFRPDLEREIDLIEEVARLYGYDKLRITTRTSLEYPVDPLQRNLDDEIRSWLVGRGFHEVVTNSMQDYWAASLGSEAVVEVANPLSKDMAFMRTSLVPSMLSVIRNNIYHGAKNLRLFEIGKVYFRDKTVGGAAGPAGFREYKRLILAFYGSSGAQNWDSTPGLVDIFDVKGEIQDLFEKIFLDNYNFIPYSTTNALTESGLLIEINGEEAGFLSAVGEAVLRRFDVGQRVYVAEISSEILERAGAGGKSYRPLPVYPVVARDLALVVDETLPVEKLAQGIRQASGPLLTSIELFDIYRGDQIAPGKKSCAFSLEYRSENHTLTQEEVERVIKKVADDLLSKFNATIRA